MVGATQKFAGWTIAEAIRRCVDPDLLSRWSEDHRGWVKGGRRSRYIFLSEQIDGYAAVHHNDRERATRTLYLQERSSYAQLLKSLRDLLRAGRILAWGRRKSPLAASAPIPQSAWNYLHIFNARKSIAVENTQGKTKIFDIRIFPLVEAPDAVERLDGKTLVEAFQICVVDDPQIAALNRRAILAGGQSASFGYDWSSHRAVWRVEHGRDGGGPGPIGCLCKFDDPIKYNREWAAKAAAARRFARLIDFLASGQLVVEAIAAGRGGMVVVPRSIWRRRQTHLDLLNGDVLELDPRADDHTSALAGPTFTGLMLSKPKATELLVVREPETPEVRKPSKSIRTIVTKANAQAACLAWLSGLMHVSPTRKTQTKAECWQQAQIKWPGKLALRGFERAWSDAVHQSEAPAWSASGRPAKSQRT